MLSVVPLGGLGEIGMNCLALECEDQILIIDCGTSFPDDDYGVDVIHPNFSYLSQREERVAGLLITHGHEDHIGAIPYLLDAISIPIFAPPHAMALIKRRLAEHGYDLDELDLNIFEPGGHCAIGKFEVESARVTHSIPMATSVRISISGLHVVHTGDFKFDPAPYDQILSDEDILESWGDQGVDLMLSDSTGADTEGSSGSESDVAEALKQEIYAGEGQRVIVSLFSSNLQRLAAVLDAAEQSHRRVCLLGRSVKNHFEIGRELGLIKVKSDRIVDLEFLEHVKPSETLIVASGSQGERAATLARLANGTHQATKIQSGDRVILSSRIIPGNEKSVFTLINDLMRAGAKVITRREAPGIHVSGHACRAELRQMFKLIRPKAFVAVHGTLLHMKRHLELASECGVSETKYTENGNIITLDDGRLEFGDKVPSGITHIAYGGEEISDSELRRRKDLGRYGVAIASLLLDRSGAVHGQINVQTRGVPGLDHDKETSLRLARAIDNCLRQHGKRWIRAGYDIEAELRRILRQNIDQLSGCRPITEVYVHYLSSSLLT